MKMNRSLKFDARQILRWSVLVSVVGMCSHNPPAVKAQESSPANPPEAVPADHPLTPVLRLAKASRDRLKQLEDYECRFDKRDVVGGRVHVHSVQVKFRSKPMSVYMRFEKPQPGREVIYVEGQNEGKLLAHETGLGALVGTIALDPKSPRAMSESRHPITEFGMHNLVDRVIEQWEAEAQFAGSETETKFYPKAKLHNMECQVIETSHPVRRRQFSFYMTRLYIDNKTQFPVRLEQYGFPQKAGEKPPLIEEYTYHQIRPNPGLDDRDFDPRNPDYGF